jgi:hypothetical protein
MKMFLIFIFVLCAFCSTSFTQTQAKIQPSLKTFELYSVYDSNSKYVSQYAAKGCFNFLTEEVRCVLSEKDSKDFKYDFRYGGLRAGDDWDWFDLSFAHNSRGKIVDLGKLNWTDSFEAPFIKPYRKLKEGEHRNVTVNTSGKNGAKGADGKKGADGQNADGSVGNKGYSAQVANDSVQTNKSEVNKNENTKTEEESYQPFTKAILGNVYVMRVVDNTNDFYVLFRIEELERGHRCKISWKRIDSPKEK